MGGIRVIQITNIAPQTTKDQMHSLFGYIGKIEQIQLYPTIREVAVPGRSLVCYVKFMDSASVGVAQHLTNTVFIDRALIVVPFSSNDIPDEQKAFEITRPGPRLAPGVTNQIEGFPPNQVLMTHDPRLIENNLPLYPPLPASTDSTSLDEIRRTVVVTNLDRSVGSQDLIELFSKAGEVKYVRFCFRPGDTANYALVELTDQTDIVAALKMNGTQLAGNIIQVYHSIQAIVKPQPKSDEAAQREIQEAMSRVNEAQSLISAAIDPVMALLKKDKKRSRSRSRGRYGRSRRSRSRSRSRHSRRRSRSRHRRSRSRSRRSRSRRHSRSRSHSKHSRRSRSRDRRRSRSRSRRRSRSRSKRSRSRSKRRSRSRSHRSSSRSKSSSSRSRQEDKKKEDKKKEEKERDKDRDKDKDKDKEKDKDKDKDKDRDKDKERDRDRDKEKEREKKDKDRERERDRDKDKEKERDRDRDREKDKERDKDRDREKDKEKDKERERERKEKEKEREKEKISEVKEDEEEDEKSSEK